MTGRLRFVAIVIVVLTAAVACGGDDSSNDPSADPGDQVGQDDGSNDSDGGTNPDDGSDDQGSNDGASDPGVGGAPNLDPGSMPPAGQAVFEVDGKTFTIAADTMDYFLCDPSAEFTNVQSESDTQDLSVQADAQSGRGGANVTVEGSDVSYQSFFGPETSGGVAVDGPHIVYEGRFDATNVDDPADFTDVGVGRVSVTCP